MAVKGVALIHSISPEGESGQFSVNVNYVGLNGDYVSGGISLENVEASVSQLLFEDAIKSAVKAILISNHSYTFGIFDTVRVIGSTL